MGERSSDADPISFLAVGDVGPIHEPISVYAELVSDTLRAGDIRFAQCERTYSTRGSLQVGSNGHNSRQPPHMAAVFSEAGFNVVSMASNHAMDWGADSLLDSITMFNGMGIQTVGAGADIKEARRPACFDIRGVSVGILGYGSVLARATPQPSTRPASRRYEPTPTTKHTTIKPGLRLSSSQCRMPRDVEAMRNDISAFAR